MAYLLTGVQHLKSGDAIMPVHSYESVDEWKEKYHREMQYAINKGDFLGLGIKVFNDATLQDVFVDIWVRENPDTVPNVED